MICGRPPHSYAYSLTALRHHNRELISIVVSVIADPQNSARASDLLRLLPSRQLNDDNADLAESKSMSAF